MDADLPESNMLPRQQPSISGNHPSDPNGAPDTQTTKQQLIPSVSGHPSPIHGEYIPPQTQVACPPLDTQMMGQVGQNYVPDMMTAAMGPSFPNFGKNMWVYNPNAPRGQLPPEMMQASAAYSTNGILVYLCSFTNLGAPVFHNPLSTPRWSSPPPFNLLPMPP
ncbi:uncharacterized protein EI90DRAFT_3117793 [Cantharellus anzutake]|uniref:uncharacterized protein n=1 Tax=Cantharellus anzutake TaxID=1750568 RepID=UPI001908B751|nr:uncharacterized protein EI90DRAFT_3117793 [Cantharellus anzutake]KAF8340020.1 hypothetical protein EI90DRAFT_3117793 [Cantharellus anzutake]